MSVLEQVDPALAGAQLAAIRKARGLTQQAVADALGVARTTVTALETGTRRPRQSEFVQLAQLYGRSVGELTRTVVQDNDDEVASFSSLLRHSLVTGEQFPKEDWFADVNDFERLCRDYDALERLTHSPLPRRYPNAYDVTGSNLNAAAEEVATSERNRLGLGDGPIGDLWSVLEMDVGLRVFAPEFQSRGLAGLFVFTEAFGGCIAVNAGHPEERRRWTAAHEYGHFLTDRYRPEITTYFDRKRLPDSERFADAFARHFLLPAAGLRRRVQAIKRSKDGPLTAADVLGVGHQYFVSFQSLILRLEELKLVQSGAWDRLKDAGFKPNEARSLLELPPIERQDALLSMRYEALAVQAFEQGLISEGRLAELLRTDRIGARERVEALTHRDYVADGDVYQLRLDLGAELTSV